MPGTATTSLPLSDSADDVIGNAAGSTIRVSMARLAALLGTLQGPAYGSVTQLQADAAWPAGAIGSVYGGTAAQIGVYRKSGAPGSGSWSRIGDLPVSSITAAQLAEKAALTDLTAEIAYRRAAIRDAGIMPLANVTGRNSISANLTPSMIEGGATLANTSTVELIPAETSAGPVQLSLDGATPVPVRDAAGAELHVGALLAGRSYFLRRRGSTWRIIAGGISSVEMRAEAQARAEGDQAEAQLRLAGDRAVGVHALSAVGGTATAITAELGFSEVPGETNVILVPAADNTGPVTLRLGTGPVRSVMGANAANLPAGDLRAGIAVLLRLTAAGDWRVVGVGRGEIATAVAGETSARVALETAVSPVVAGHVIGEDQNILTLVDAGGGVVARIDGSARLRLVGLTKDVAGALNDLTDRVDQAPSGDEMADVLFDLRDADGRVAARMSADGALHLIGLGQSVQSEMADLRQQMSRRASDTLTTLVPPDLDLAAMTGLSSPATTSILSGAASRGVAAPLPCWQIEQSYTPPEAWFSSLRWQSTAQDGYLNLDSPYRANDQFVHPRMLYFPHGWHGYRWIMGINPYATFVEENPCLYGSNDLRNWQLLSHWAPMPLATPAKAYLSDIMLTYDPTRGEIICLWRGQEATEGSVEWAYYMRRTVDGYSWTETETLFEASRHGGGQAVCPSLIYNVQTRDWWLFVSGLNGMTAFRSATLDYRRWVSQPLTGAPADWHTDVTVVGNRLLALSGHHYNVERSLRVAYSAPGDWSIWTTRTDDALDASALVARYGAPIVPYKVSAVPIVRTTGVIDTYLAWTTESLVDGLRWRLFVTKTSFNL